MIQKLSSILGLRLVRRARRIAIFAVAFAAGLWVSDRWMTARAVAAAGAASPLTKVTTTRPTSRRTTMPATTRAATTRPVLPADVAAIARRVRDAYAVHPLRLRATLASDFDAGGMTDHSSHAITAVLESVSRFRHESAGELRVIADGSDLIVLDLAANAFEKQAFTPSKIGPTFGEDARAVLAQQDPALFVAVTSDAEALFAPDSDAHVRLLPPAGDDRGSERVESTLSDGTIVTYAIDRAKGTIQSVDWDFAKLLRDHGASDVKRATATLHYDETSIGGDAPAADAFAITLPPGAHAATNANADDLMSDIGAGGDPGAALTGNPAPPIALADLDAKIVNAAGPAAAQGNVVILDFWASWCPPCVAGMADLDAFAARVQGRGAILYAINEGEDPDVVRNFVVKEGFSHLLPLLDADPEMGVGKDYHVHRLPQLVIIGRDGNVRQVIVGSSPKVAEQLDAAVTDALK